MDQGNGGDVLIGRDADLSALLSVRDKGRRLITIVGPGGVGKTQFAKEALRRTGDEALEGFVDLTRAKTADGVLSEIGTMLGMRIGDVRSSDAAKDRIVDAVARRGRMLFVFDNLEQVTDEVRPLMQALLAGAPDATFIATSREPIGLRDEYRFELVPLGDDDAVTLFIDRAHKARPDLDVSEAADLVARVTSKLSNLPLAIELAAARMEILSLEQLEQRLDTPLDLLKSTNPELSERHRTLLATMQWSWELLDETEQRALAWCSTFHGDFTLELCERLLPPSIDAMDALQSLKRKSLVTLRPGPEQRFFFLESVKAFASQRLAEHDDREQAEKAHALLFAEQGEQLDPNREADLLRAPSLQDDLIAMLFELSVFDAARAARILVHLMPFLNRTVVVDSHFGFYDRLAHGEGVDDATRALLWTGRAQLAVESARLVDCERDVGAALELLEGPLGAPPEATAHALGVRAAWLTNNGRFDEARADIKRCLELLPAGTPAHAKALMRDFVTYLFEGRYDEAEPLGGKALLATERGGDKRDAIYILTNLAYLRAERGQLDDSRRDLLAGQALAERFASENVQSILLFNLAWLELELENRERTLTLCQELEERATRYGLARLEGLGAVVEGIVRAEQGDLETAQDRLLHAEALSVEKDLVTRARFSPRAYRACVLARLGRTAEAKSILAELEADESIAPHFADARRFLMMAASILLRRAEDKPEDDLIQIAKEKLSDKTPLGGPFRIARRWLVHVLATRAGRVSPDNDAMGPLLKVGPDAHWFDMAGQRSDIRRRGAMRRVFMALSDTLEKNPGLALTLDDVLEAGWPGQSVSPEAGANRVYTVVRNLRRAGLEGVLLTRDDGYLIDPSVRLLRVED